MKRILIAMSIFSMIIVNAQTKTKVGLKTGLNIANFRGDNENSSSRTGIYIGGYVRIPVANKFSIQPELLYSMQGAKEDVYIGYTGYNFYPVKAQVKYKFDYINIPIMAQYEIVKGLRAEIGPQIGFIVNKKAEIDLYGYKISDPSVKTVDFGLNFGANYELTNGLNFAIRYNLGLTDINDSQTYNEINNSVFSFGIGYTF